MFDVGFWEVALIGVIALLVVGPERLPALARNVGLWVGRLRRYVNHVKQDIEREIHADEMRELIRNPGSASSGLSELNDVARETASAVDDLRRGLNDAAKGSEDAAPPVQAASAPDGPSQQEDPAAVTRATAAIPHHAVDEDPCASPGAVSEAQEISAKPAGDGSMTQQAGADSEVGSGPGRVDDEQSFEPPRRD